LLGKKLLTEEEYQDCDVFGLTEHFDKKYYLYHEHAEIIKELFETAEKFPEDKREEFIEKMVEFIGDKGNSDKDLKEKLMNRNIDDFYRDPIAIKYKQLLGKLALGNGVHD
jgi:metallophosphoesterase superfamily enzyme